MRKYLYGKSRQEVARKLREAVSATRAPTPRTASERFVRAGRRRRRAE
jgi:hypothetical protein